MNEIKLVIGEPSLSGLYARTIQGTTLGSSIPLAEVTGAGGVYAGDMSGAAGYYAFLFYDATNQLIGTAGVSYWDGTQFIGLNTLPDSSGVTTLLVRLTSGRAANLDNLDAAVSSRLPTSSYVVPLDNIATQNAVSTALTTYGALTMSSLRKAEAAGVGRFKMDYSVSPPLATQYDEAGNVVATFELYKEDGVTPATSPQDAYWREPI